MNTDTVVNNEQQDQPFSLAHHITWLLEQAEVANAADWMVGIHPEALNHTDINVQRFQINRHWVAKFTSLPTEEEVLQTRNARGCLMGIQCSLEDYLRLFQTEVIPCALKHNLIQKIG